MRIGVVSDTHNRLPNVVRIVEIFNTARVERVIHTGDITQARTLDALAALHAPLTGVFGNNDEKEALRAVATHHGMQLSDGPLDLTLAGRRILVTHDPKDLDLARRPEHQIGLHGHNHRRVIERAGNQITFNPGECAGHIEGYNAVGILDLASLDIEIIRF